MTVVSSPSSMRSYPAFLTHIREKLDQNVIPEEVSLVLNYMIKTDVSGNVVNWKIRNPSMNKTFETWSTSEQCLQNITKVLNGRPPTPGEQRLLDSLKMPPESAEHQQTLEIFRLQTLNRRPPVISMIETMRNHLLKVYQQTQGEKRINSLTIRAIFPNNVTSDCRIKLDDACASCGQFQTTRNTLMKCSDCAKALYCNQLCHTNASRDHQFSCLTPRSEVDDILEELCGPSDPNPTLASSDSKADKKGD